LPNYNDGPAIAIAVRALVQGDFEQFKKQAAVIKKDIEDLFSEGIFTEKVIKKTTDTINTIKQIVNRDPEAAKGTDQYAVKGMNAISSGENKIADEGIKMVKKTVGLLEDIHQRLVSASPLLRTIESLFNLAVQLFFMPLGNKLAEVMIPAVIELVDEVTALWDSFEGKTLGEILETMLTSGAQIFGGYFLNLAEQLKDEGGLLGGIANLLSAIGSFIEGDMVNVIKTGLTIFTFIVNNLKEIIATIVAFKVASLANQVATMFVIATSSSFGGKFGTGFAVAGAATTASAMLGTGAGLTAYNYMNNGGDLWGAAGNAAGSMVLGPAAIPATVARQKIVGEASGISSKRETTINNTYTFNGLTDRELEKKIINLNNQQYNEYRLRSTHG
jgi:hypothetical protein